MKPICNLHFGLGFGQILGGERQVRFIRQCHFGSPELSLKGKMLGLVGFVEFIDKGLRQHDRFGCFGSHVGCQTRVQ